ncbi:MAG: bifunctional riboflavin kinase/FAD synthetase [Verrucomicrobia bacterium]|jgi:riboflavin kinase/FMN adenylyltransferase|nr:bifunctional riboflavin kinase/FAD synthetase [Verrucomicrobiota bacterium]
MLVARSAQALATPGRKVCLAIGFFDGVHLGHQQIIRQAEEDARQHDATSVVVTFDRHPASVVDPDRAPALIQTTEHRLRTLKTLGPDAVLLLPFDTPLREQSGEQFIRQLHQALGGLQSICIGADFHFGYQRSGNVSLLRELGRQLGFQVHGIAGVALEGRTISSTRIREAIRSGELETAGQMLGRSYSISSRVIRGDQLGHQLRFPTANLEVAGLALPPDGVYMAQAEVEGRRHHAVVNIGNRPTITPKASDTRLEAHLLDFDGNLYGRELEVIFVERLREERRFASRDELQQQIERDVAEARHRFG